MLFPFYIYGQSPMVLGIPSASPLSGYLSAGDVIVSVDGMPIRNAQEWMDMAAFLNELSVNDGNRNKDAQRVGTRGKGYCVPDPMVEESKRMVVVDNRSFCPDGLTSFRSVPCAYTSITGDDHLRNIEESYCLNAKDVVKFDKYGDGWPPTITNGSSCICSQHESCLSPIQIPGLIWVEVTYSRPYSLECLRVRRKSFADSRSSDSMESNCGGTFVFVGDVISMAQSVQLTAYRPCWAFPLATYLPNVLERILRCTFQDHAAAAIARDSASVFAWKGETLREYWWCTERALDWGPGGGPDLIADDGGDATLLIREGVKAEEIYEKTGALPDPASTDNQKFQLVLTIIRDGLKTDPKRYHKMKDRLVGVSEGDHHWSQEALPDAGKRLIVVPCYQCQ